MHSPLILDQLADVMIAERYRAADRHDQLQWATHRPTRWNRLEFRRELGRILIRAGAKLASEPILVPEPR